MENHTQAKKGLTSKQASELILRYGKNELNEGQGTNVFLSFLSQFNNFLILLLLAASVVSFSVSEYLDGVFILGIVLINALFGFYQERRAEKTLATLKKITLTNVRTIRDGKEIELDSKLLVPGDMVYLEEGSKIPADCHITESINLEVNEAALSGESLSVLKSKKTAENELFMGTVVASGRAYAKVVQTGNDTRFGSIAKTLKGIKEVKTPLQKKLGVFTKQIGVIGIFASVVVFCLSFVRDKDTLEGFILAVSLAVAAVPEGLPAVMTIILSIGVENMARKKRLSENSMQ